MTLVKRSSRDTPPSAPAVRGDEDAPVAVEGIDCMEIALPDGQEGGDIEELLVKKLEALHAVHAVHVEHGVQISPQTRILGEKIF